MTRIFITGGTGYIGGTLLHDLTRTHPTTHISALARSETSARLLLAAFPDIRIVHGDLDDAALLEREAAKADIAINVADIAHINSTRALHRGLASHSKTTYLLQMSGATCVAQGEIASGTFGEHSDQIFDDYDGIDALRAEIKRWPHREVDNYLLDLTDDTPSVRSAVVFGPIIYGEGTGPAGRRSVQIPEMARVALDRGRAVYVGKGVNRWGSVHVRDVSRLFGALVKRAVEGGKQEGVWGRDGLYFAGTGEELTFGEIATKIGQAAKKLGLIEEPEPKSVTPAEADHLIDHASVIIGTNARGRAMRASKVVAWQPSGHSLDEEIPRAVAAEAKAEMIIRLRVTSGAVE